MKEQGTLGELWGQGRVSILSQDFLVSVIYPQSFYLKWDPNQGHSHSFLGYQPAGVILSLRISHGWETYMLTRITMAGTGIWRGRKAGAALRDGEVTWCH